MERHRIRPDRLGRARELRRGQTVPEQLLWHCLRDKRLSKWKFRRQVPVGPYVADFACLQARLIVELDGRSHDHSAESDATRDAWFRARGYRVLRFTNDAVLCDRGVSVADTILAVLDGRVTESMDAVSPIRDASVERGC